MNNEDAYDFSERQVLLGKRIFLGSGQPQVSAGGSVAGRCVLSRAPMAVQSADDLILDQDPDDKQH